MPEAELEVGRSAAGVPRVRKRRKAQLCVWIPAWVLREIRLEKARRGRKLGDLVSEVLIQHIHLGKGGSEGEDE